MNFAIAVMLRDDGLLSLAKGLQKLNGDCAGVIPDFHVCLLFAAAVVYGVRKILSV